MKHWNTNAIIGNGFVQGLEEFWNNQDIGFMSAQIVLNKMLRRISYALTDQKDPDDEQKLPKSFTIGSV